MHVLTKVFVVLVSLLSVALVPLVVTYAHNENSYKAKYDQQRANLLVAQQQQQAAVASQQRIEASLTNQIKDLEAKSLELTRSSNEKSERIRSLTNQLSDAEANKADIMAKLSQIASSGQAMQTTLANLVIENDGLRSANLTAERQAVELDQRLRDVEGQYDVARQAIRSLQEELQQVREERDVALSTVASIAQQHPNVVPNLKKESAPAVDVDVNGTVVNVVRNDERALAEINVGSRDGIKEDWKLLVSRGGRFLGNLRIIEVDIQQSTGVIELEDPQIGLVQPGDAVAAHKDASVARRGF